MPRPLSIDGDRIVDVDGDIDFGAVAGQSFIDGIIHDFVDQMVQTRFARRPDIHGGPFAHRLQTFQNFDGTGIVNIGRRQNFICHSVLISFVYCDCDQMRMGITTYRYCSCSCAFRRQHRLQFARALLIFQRERHLFLRNRAQEVQQILRVEADLEIRTRIFAGTLSSDSPVSSADEKIFTSPAVNCTRIARERSSANWATRSIAPLISSF